MLPSVKLLFSATALILCSAAVGLACSLYQYRGAQALMASTHHVHRSAYALAHELRQSSDDLTRLARTFVNAPDDRWVEQYEAILAIRSGKQPRPAQYGKVYWDYKAAGLEPARGWGKPASLYALLRQGGFSDAERASFVQALGHSDQLAKAERHAMNLAVGLHTDAQGQHAIAGKPDAEAARELLYAPQYHLGKAEVMKPLDAFLMAVDERSEAQLAESTRSARHWFAAAALSAATLCFASLALMWLMARWIMHRLYPALRVMQGQAHALRTHDEATRAICNVAGSLQQMSDHLARMAAVPAAANADQAPACAAPSASNVTYVAFGKGSA